MKKNLLVIIAILACMALVIGVFAACGGKRTDKPSETPASTQPADNSGEQAADNGDEAKAGAIVGSWEYTSGGYVYTFNADGTGSYTAGETVMEFTYEDDGSTVKILYSSATVPNEFAYTISGNTLSIEDSFGEKVEYTKK